GTNPNWHNYFHNTGAHPTPLPTYPFQTHRYWPNPAARGSSTSETGHPLLGSVVDLAHSSGSVLSGQLSTRLNPWLADHVVAGSIVFPGTAFVDLALHAAARSGRHDLQELTLESPLMLSEEDSVELQVTVGEPDGDGLVRVSVHSRPADSASWQLHATGLIGGEQPSEPSWSLRAWPPSGSVPLPAGDCYAAFAAAGLDYGPLFQGLRAAWRVGEEVAVEVELPGDEDHASGYGLHPALLDSVLHAVGVGRMFGDDGQAWLPFSWAGVRMYTKGASSLRAVLSPASENAISLRIADQAGHPVAEVERLSMRKITGEHFSKHRQSLFEQIWVPRQIPGTAASLAVLGAEVESADATHALVTVKSGDSLDPEDVLMTTTDVLDKMLSHADARTLVVVTTHAMAVGNEPSPAGAAVWGLVRAAQAEQPNRIVLVDLDDDERSRQALPYALNSGEPQFALRQGEMRVPRLVPAAVGPATSPEWESSTVLVTGAAGSLGSLVAQHLVRTHGVTDLVLVSRHGDAPEPDGAVVRQLACDLTDPKQIAAALTAVPSHRPLAIVHCAGSLDDATFENQTPDRIRTVFAPKATAAWHLHELTRDRDVTAFILFSSAAATLGSPGQANYAAANAYLDALAHHRTTTGHPTTSIAWGPWTTGMAATGDEADRRRLTGTGLVPIDEETGQALFDAAVSRSNPVMFPLPMDKAALRRHAAGPGLSPLLRDLVPQPVQSTTPTAGRLPLSEVLSGLAPHEQKERVTQIVLRHTAAASGHESAEAIPMDEPFTDRGFNSLMAVELRGALDVATGLRLPATLIFDHPTPAALSDYLMTLLVPQQASTPDAIFAEIDRLEANLKQVGQGHAAQVRSRLKSLVNAWESAGKDAPDTEADELTSAGLEDMFDIIDDELGLS
ncbi:type I polyketide synthase, partial [Streptomyces coeruleorubidus]|uniref:type I polyketide synthase n=1 Tax=Streptomyces coeruleorubidus TaxID=116188 RepID=UPI003408DD64